MTSVEIRKALEAKGFKVEKTMKKGQYKVNGRQVVRFSGADKMNPAYIKTLTFIGDEECWMNRTLDGFIKWWNE